MAFALVQAATGSDSSMTGSAMSCSATFSLPVTAGNLIFVIAGVNGGTASPADVAPTDSLGNTYYFANRSSDAGWTIFPNVTVWGGYVSSPGACTVAANWTTTTPGSTFTGSVVILEYSGYTGTAGILTGLDKSLQVNSLSTGNTFGFYSGYDTRDGAIVISCAFNTATAALTYNTWIEARDGVYSDTLPSVGSGDPYFSEILLFGDLVFPVSSACRYYAM